VSVQSGLLADSGGRRCFIGGSDARIIMGNDANRLDRLWREKRGGSSPRIYPGNSSCSLAP
jgi:predicted phage-related endonuclease